ncbi:magnesium transporter CorA family protein [Thermobispora bispora]|mgnify:CR=1 FL=1|uniref:Mg2 transporter protein CorA family protein n=1 Tax=Thermobispora bispora (strain ATCC 19993 / DSM 43833 / CBS 139.67 / JCM 10125 / KCTC 9307 / NBRC 14880 / R51) TaxID=469371 RepID=D6Y4F9_THEBD|nr:magnesium transporter CorA family protein [Thermobispora bispora]ADG87213.1 Mg2 transporter protein CorA family protein [Thermobispora bispora DSM 43833]MDI9580096.1 magnesium transporter CorA family protein [Thermobispora sp.]
MARSRLYRNGALAAEGFPAAEVAGLIRDPSAVVWLDLCAPGREELEALGAELGVHELAVEDAVKRRQRPKLDAYDGHLFLSVHAARFDAGSGGLRVAEAAAFVARNVLVTVREPDFPIDEVVRRWDEQAGLAAHGVMFLLYGLLDYVVDTHFDAVERIDDEVEALEETVFGDGPVTPADQRRAYRIRKSLVRLRRIVVPMREVVNGLMRREEELGDGRMRPYLLDVYDHVLRATEWTESLRELLADIREAHLTMQGNRMNMIMKRVTSWAAIIAVPTLITGFYGQNLPFPGFGQVWGFWVSNALIVIASVTLYLTFRSRDWL